ncbi:MAG: TIM barrel protein [Propionibacteriales bacterium]|nr:TIM barrel protein [Propionibacteriales bacterium]
MSAPEPVVALSTASVYPESTASGFELAGRVGYDAVELMVGLDPVSQDTSAVKHLSEYHQLPICAVHAPCLLITQRVWGTEPWAKLEQSAEMAAELGAPVVVVHPPFRWQRDYARTFIEGIAKMEAETGVQFAVENMFPWRAVRRDVQAYVPGLNPVEHDFANVTLDLSHTATSSMNPVEMAAELGDRLAHVHLADGSGSAKDEHLVPGRGNQPCAEFLEFCASTSFSGAVVLEINTRRSGSRTVRETDLAEALAFTRLNLVATPDFSVAPDGTIERTAP